MRIWSIGHGTRTTHELIGLLREHGIRTLVDVRSYPGSRRHPHLAREPLAASLEAAGIRYVHLRGLGGRRLPRASSPHVAIRSSGFRAYADHMSTDEFATDHARLRELASEAATAFMCAETLWWRCHRRLLADRLVTDGWDVLHIIRAGETSSHKPSPEMRVVGGRILYDQTAGGTQSSLEAVENGRPRSS